MTEFKPIKEGKVREIYDNGDSLIMVATDRISAFDVILKNKVTKKVTGLPSAEWFYESRSGDPDTERNEDPDPTGQYDHPTE